VYSGPATLEVVPPTGYTMTPAALARLRKSVPALSDAQNIGASIFLSFNYVRIFSFFYMLLSFAVYLVYYGRYGCR
jgi:hypothetical protein